MTVGQLEQYQHFLVENEYDAIIVDEKEIYIRLDVNDLLIDIVCSFPDYFPYQFPVIKLTEESRKKCAGIPHVVRDGSLCLFNAVDARPNFLDPEQLLLETIEKAEIVIKNGLNLENLDDYKNEFLEYWNGKTAIEFRSFVDFPNYVCRFVGSYIKENERDGYMILAKDRSQLTELAESMFHKVDVDKVQQGLYIPLDNGFYSHEVQNEKDIWKIIAEKCDGEQKKRIVAEMRAMHNKCSLFVVSIPLEESKFVYLGWIGSSIQDIPGFRKNKISPFVYWEMKKSSELNHIVAARVTRCSQEYLFYRGGYGFNRRLKSVGIVGCGSLGAEIALQMASMGTDHFILLDNEKLAVDNIARHICGYDWVGIAKVYGVQYRLQRWNPNISCVAIYGDAHNELENCIDQINAMDCLILAVGDMALEAYVLKMAEKGIIKVPIILVWVEPRCYAGHLIYISKANGAFDSLVDLETLTYYDSVILSQTFVEYVPGCQSGYIPYSGLDVKQFLSRCLHELSNIWSNPKLQGNYHMIWLGDLSEARRQKIVVNEKYRESKDFSMELKRFD